MEKEILVVNEEIRTALLLLLYEDKLDFFMPFCMITVVVDKETEEIFGFNIYHEFEFSIDEQNVTLTFKTTKDDDDNVYLLFIDILPILSADKNELKENAIPIWEICKILTTPYKELDKFIENGTISNEYAMIVFEDIKNLSQIHGF